MANDVLDRPDRVEFEDHKGRGLEADRSVPPEWLDAVDQASAEELARALMERQYGLSAVSDVLCALAEALQRAERPGDLGPFALQLVQWWTKAHVRIEVLAYWLGPWQSVVPERPGRVAELASRLGVTPRTVFRHMHILAADPNIGPLLTWHRRETPTTS